MSGHEKEFKGEDILEGQMNILDYLESFDKAEEVDIRGLMDDGYCPECGAALDDEEPRCPYCDQKLSWNRWRYVNKLREGEMGL